VVSHQHSLPVSHRMNLLVNLPLSHLHSRLLTQRLCFLCSWK
jgi:hypothetical protein